MSAGKKRSAVLSKTFFVISLVLCTAGALYSVYYFLFKGGYYDYSGRIAAASADKTVFTYYFFWYDNNSGGPAEDTIHIYNNAEKLPPDHPYYMKNITVFKSVLNISAGSYVILKVDELNGSFLPDFDMLQTHAVTDGPNITVFGLKNTDVPVFESGGTVEEYGKVTGNDVYHRLLYTRLNLGSVVIFNPNSIAVNAAVECRVFNDSLTHHPDGSLFLGDFSYKNVYWHMFEVEMMMKAGIDVILPVYWGNWSGDWNIGGMKNLVKAMELLEEKYGYDKLPKIAMFMDTTAFLTKFGYPPDISRGEGLSLFSYFIGEFYSLVPEKYVFDYNGNYLVWMYSSAFVSDYNDTTFITASEYFEKTFGKELIFVGSGFTDKARATQFGAYSWGVSLNGPKVVRKGIAIGCVGPGFYSLGAYRYGWQWNEGIRYRSREDCNYYTESFRSVMPTSKWIVLEVWNEFHEGNDLTYTVEFGDRYINLTSELVKEFKLIPQIDIRESDIIIVLTVIFGVASVIIKKRK